MINLSLFSGTSQLVKRVATMVQESETFLYFLYLGKVLTVNNEDFSECFKTALVNRLNTTNSENKALLEL